MAEVLIVGSGGREYELGRAISISPEVEKIYFSPGNAGTEMLPKGENTSVNPLDFPSDVFTVIGPEAPLVAGLADELRTAGRLVFGPSSAAAKLEGSKSFAATFMKENGIPQPNFYAADNLSCALALTEGADPSKYVIKADGIASGKGVVLPKTVEQAEEVIKDMFHGKYEGAGSERVVFQERLSGPEASVFVVSDGKNFTILPLAQDHKRLKEGDMGPNTGGMGSYAPASPLVNDSQLEKIFDIAEKTINGMRNLGTPYQGLLYIGLILAEEYGGDPCVIEYNCRFGDPETQVVLPLLENAGVDTYQLLKSASECDIGKRFSPTSLMRVGGAALTVCLAASGYPENPKKGDIIHGLDKEYRDVIVHHAGTKRQNNNIVTAGGRVLYLTGLGETMDEAAERAYSAVGTQGVHFNGMQYRRDIGHQLRTNYLAK
jgi:phosphoribosylamine---glycine ligase